MMMLDDTDDRTIAEEIVEEETVEEGSGSGQTFEPERASDEGLSYTPPRDPPVIPSETDPQGIEVAAGFAPSMEDTVPERRVLPDELERADLEIQEEIARALRYNSETTNLAGVSALVNQGVVSLYGTVPDEDDAAEVYRIVSELEGVVNVISHLDTEF